VRAQTLGVALLLGVILSGASPPGWVHHSGAMFDRTRVVTVNGVVREFQWSNPHSSFTLNVIAADGKVETWSIEMNGVSNLVRQGWKRSTLKTGDKVTVRVNPLRDGRPGGWYVSITLADGKSLGGGDDPPAGGTQ
jgi:hypothetical protein